MKAYLLNHYLEQFRGTVFARQCLQSLKTIHAAVERNEPDCRQPLKFTGN